MDGNYSNSGPQKKYPWRDEKNNIEIHVLRKKIF